MIAPQLKLVKKKKLPVILFDQTLETQTTKLMTIENIVFISGFSQVGKTSALEYIETRLGIPCFSTSRVLDQLLKFVDSTYNLGLELVNHPGRRENKIRLAEEIIVPIFGRNVFALGVCKQLPTEAKTVVIETIGGEECRSIISMLDYMGFDEAWQWDVNIRSQREVKGVDIRQLLSGAETINNDGSIADFYESIEGYFMVNGLL